MTDELLDAAEHHVVAMHHFGAVASAEQLDNGVALLAHDQARIVAVEPGEAAAGQHGVATATIAARYGMRVLDNVCRDRRRTANRRARFQSVSKTPEALHHCETCGATEISHPDAEFRVTANGHEFCLEHLPSRNA